MVKNDIIMVLMMPMNMMIIFWVNDSSLMGKLDIAVNKKAIKTNRNENPAALSFLPSRAFFAISIALLFVIMACSLIFYVILKCLAERNVFVRDGDLFFVKMLSKKVFVLLENLLVFNIVW